VGATIIIVLTFAAGFLAVFAANLLLLDIIEHDQNRIRKRINDQMLQQQRERAKESKQRVEDLGDLAAEAFGEASSDSFGLAEWYRSLVEQSGIRQTPAQLLMVIAISAGVPALLAALAFPYWYVVLPTALVAGSIPLIIVQVKRFRRMEMLRSQLPESFDLMARVLRAGQSMPQAMHSVSQEFKPPVALEFAYCYEQQNLGLLPELALRDLARRTGLLEIKIFVLAVLVHQQTGGNLTEILEKLAYIVRDRFRIRGLIASLTAEGRVQAAILLALPVAMFVILLFVNREYALKLFDRPVLPITALVFMGLGAVWIRKIVNFDF